MQTEHTIYTIGHSTHTIDDFITILQTYNIQLLADVRTHPGSQWNPQFNKPALSTALLQHGIDYKHMPALGGKLDASFGSYTEYMKTIRFANSIAQLQRTASEVTVVYMCAEADWAHCHRAKISAYLALNNWRVMHIINEDKVQRHPVDILSQGRLF